MLKKCGDVVKPLATVIFSVGIVTVLLALASPTSAVSTCSFTTVGATMTLDGDCTTDEAISIPDGFTLEGANHTITALDPSGGHFVGAVVKNQGTTASVKNLTITTNALANVCDAGDNRLRGIMFEGASGRIMGNKVMNINQGASGCQEGNAIEVRNAPFDGTHPNTMVVKVSDNEISDYQKTGIVANGDVNVNIQNNKIGASATQADLAANSVQLGFGALGIVQHNNIDGNSWKVDAYWASTAVLLYLAGDGVEVRQNVLGGNADVGIYILADNAIVINNKVFESGDDGAYDIGVGNYGSGNYVTKNKVRGYETPYEGDVAGKNKVIPGPNN